MGAGSEYEGAEVGRDGGGGGVRRECDRKFRPALRIGHEKAQNATKSKSEIRNKFEIQSGENDRN
jgi:hypothetical protein